MSSLSSAMPAAQIVLRADAIGRELSAIRNVRVAVDGFLASEGLAQARDDVLLVLSELVTNSLIHTDEAPAVVVRHVREPERVDIEVSDHSTDVPAPRIPDAAGRGGRGLRIVAQVATAWGVRPADDGKTTWASLVIGATRPGCAAATQV